MNFKAGHATTLLAGLLGLVAVGGIAVYQILGKREKDQLAQNLVQEASELSAKLEKIFQDPGSCTLNLSGKSKSTNLTELSSLETGVPEKLFVVNQKIGRLKLDVIRLSPGTVDKEESNVEVMFSFSNFLDEDSKKILGVKEYKRNFIIKVNDCPVEMVKAMDENKLNEFCSSTPPEGLGGKPKKIFNQGNLNTDVSFLMECMVCKGRSRNIIYNCL